MTSSWSKALLLVALCATLPLFAPPAWAQHGAFPHVAAITVIYTAIVVGADAAVLIGVAIGLAGAPFTAEPLGQQAFLLGAAGWIAGKSRATFHRDRLSTQMVFVAVAVMGLRLADALAAQIALGGAVSACGISGWPLGALPAGVEPQEALRSFAGMRPGPVLGAAVLSALSSALVAPVFFAVITGSRLLRSFESRSARRV